MMFFVIKAFKEEFLEAEEHIPSGLINRKSVLNRLLSYLVARVCRIKFKKKTHRESIMTKHKKTAFKRLTEC